MPPGYTTLSDRLRIRCARGHTWKVSAKQIANGSWCRTCREEDLLAELRSLAEGRGGECLSSSCRNGNERLVWRCVQKHQFLASGESVKAGNWCGICRGSPHGDIHRMRRMARERGGECLSRKYLGHQGKLRWRCKEGHEWSTVPGSIIQGSWCPSCQRRGGHSLARLSIEIMRRMAAERGGRCLSATYHGVSVPLRWRCARGHTWTAMPARMRAGRWCPVCARTTRGTIEGMRELALLRGGRCLTRTWDNHREPLVFECARRHRFRAFASVVKTGMWCPSCRR